VLIAQQAEAGRVTKCEAGLEVNAKNAFGSRLQKESQCICAFEQCPFRLLPPAFVKENHKAGSRGRRNVIQER
jgi:hypothetical protein